MNLHHFTPAPGPACPVVLGEHLSSQQFAELLAGPAGATSGHLLVCQACAQEFDTLRESLSQFRQAANAYVASEIRKLPPIDPGARTRFRPWVAMSLPASPAMLATAAALIMAAIVPLQIQRQRAFTAVPAIAMSTADAHTPESDDALLKDVDRELAVSVPAAMQALAGPADADDDSYSNPDGPGQTATQRKD